jgi:4-amino-4-deoxy-L-arabinose transferase-like glycosyltransferase
MTISAPAPTRLTLWRGVVAAAVLFAVFFQLGGRALNEPDEGRFAEIGREMLVSGDYLTPRLNGIEHLSKPPVTYWLIALSLRIFGVNEFAARLPSAMGALGTVIAVYLLARSARGEVTALWAVMVLSSSTLFLAMARVITTDMLLTCFVTWSVWTFWRWYASADRGWGKIVWFYAFLGIGMMTKGPVAVVLPLFAVIGLRWRNQHFRLKQMRWGWGALVFLAVSAPWFVAIATSKPDVWRYFIVREVVERVATKEHGRIKAWWYFFPVLAGGFLPWTTLLPALAVLRGEPDKTREVVRLCASWAVLGLALFTLSGSKLPSYVLPLFTPLAILVGVIIAKGTEIQRQARGDQSLRVSFLVAAPLFLAAAIAVIVYVGKTYGSHQHLPWAILTAVGLGSAAWIATLSTRRVAMNAGGLAVASMGVVLTLMMAISLVERNLAGKTSAKFFAARIRREDPTNRLPVVSYHDLMRGLPFYLQRSVLWYRLPLAAHGDVFEFTSGSVSSSNVLTELQQVRGLMGGSQRVFCVATIVEFATMTGELRQPLYKLEEAGERVLLSNQP